MIYLEIFLQTSVSESNTTWRENEFYTTTNYIYEVDMITLNLSYTFQNGKNRSRFIESEFGKREF